jgi:hypothetical protein
VFLEKNCCWGIPPPHIVKRGDESAESVHIPLKDVHGMHRMGCSYLDLLYILILHAGLKTVVTCDVSISRCSQDDFVLGGAPSLLPPTVMVQIRRTLSKDCFLGLWACGFLVGLQVLVAS